MTKRDELFNLDSCLNKARNDEYLFVLLARDRAMPNAIRAWVAERLSLGMNQLNDPQLIEALALADLVERQQKGSKG